MTVPQQQVLVDRLATSWLREGLLALVGVLLLALSSQLVLPLPFTPVPLSAQTFAVLLVGAGYGATRGGVTVGLYVLVGAAGVPVYADGARGIDVLLGATGGYLLGFVVAAAVIGVLAQHGFDRRARSMVASFVVGSAIIYLLGVTGLIALVGLDLPTAIRQGVVPFLVGDAIKAVLAGALVPRVWRALGEDRSLR